MHTRVTSMLLTVSFVWLLLTTPFTISGFLFTIADISVETASLLMPFKAVAFLLMYSNHAVNFYLYCLTGHKFRRELYDTLTALRDWLTGRHHRTRQPSCVSCVTVADRGSSRQLRRGRSNTIELTSRTDLGSRLASTRKSDV